MRRILGVVLAALGGLLAAFIMAEYEFEGLTPWAAGLAVGVLVGEVLAGVGRWRGRSAMATAAAIAVATMVYGQWLESEAGLEPWAQVTWPAAALAAVIAVWNVRPRRAEPAGPTPGTSAGS